MQAPATDGRIAECGLVNGRHRASAVGVIVVLAVASGFAIGVGAVVERVTTTDTMAHASVAEANQASLAPSSCYFGDPWCDAFQGESGSSSRHVVDRWFDDESPRSGR